ncbi:probable RNA-directed DNA polymerase from transposon BS [Trichonephila inaurata madagascariensis]|uniref:Probable RNA-directed DNA polymerase from transposon BS n=1 Tax=Trichonephila inaurata madagascariensis TaxID=2747483 RepID=A0A8X6K0T4_9ARAC|nr:probable RNA-directed DNA polymerase from transposon BS [Trichonephila inaurata madagascariensis]
MIRTSSGRNTFKIISWNADGVLNKIDELAEYLAENDPDVIALQETFLRPCLDLNIANYTTHRNDRMTDRGGGTAILVKNSIPHHSIQINTNMVETTTILIESHLNNAAICSLYKPPRPQASNLISDLLKIFRNRTQCINVGDYNAKHTSWSATTVNNPAGTALARFIQTSGFLLTAPNSSTRVPNRGRTATLDFGISCGLNDVTAEAQDVGEEPPTQSLAEDPIPSSQGGDQPNSKVHSIRPEKIKRACVRLPTEGCRHRHRITPQACSRQQQQEEHPLPPLDFRGLVYGTKEKADLFVDNLEESFTENRTPYGDDHIDKVDRYVRNFLSNYNTPVRPLTSPSKICDIISKLKVHKAPGHDQIRNISLKSLPMNAITYLTKIFNKGLLLQYIPQIWKHCTITLLPKKNKNPKFPLNYRPISLIACVAKLFEKIILFRIQAFADTHHLIPDFQHGFRKETSTSHQYTTNKIIDGFNKQRTTGGVFLDVEKALDRVWHNGLIYKLIQTNFSLPDQNYP